MQSLLRGSSLGTRINGRVWRGPNQVVIALALAVTSLVVHWPLGTRSLFAWDSVLYVESLDDFNIALHRPHPPGYLWYVLTARLVRLLFGLAPNDAFVLLSQLAGAASVAVLFLVGTALFNRPVGLVTALVAASSVAFSIYSGVAYPYTILTLGSSLLGWLAWRVGRGESSAILLGLALGLGSGYRQDLLLFLGPLSLVAILRGPEHGRLMLAILAGLAGLLSWLIPTIWLSGGPVEFTLAIGAQASRIERDTAVTAHGLIGLLDNSLSLLRYSFSALHLAALALCGWLFGRLLTASGRRDPRFHHLLVWGGPAVIFYCLIHIGDVGYVFSFMPPAWLAAGAGLVQLSGWLTHWSGRHRLTLIAVVGVPIAFNLWWLIGSQRPLSAYWLQCRDRQLAEAVSVVETTYSPMTTMLITSSYFQQARFYLPGHRLVYFDPFKDGGLDQAIPPNVTRLVVFDWLLQAAPHPRAEGVPLSCGYSLSTFQVKPGDRVIIRETSVELVR